MGLIKVELDSATETHLRRFMKFMGTEWANQNVDPDLDIALDRSSEVMTVLIAKYVEWLEAGEPT